MFFITQHTRIECDKTKHKQDVKKKQNKNILKVNKINIRSALTNHFTLSFIYLYFFYIFIRVRVQNNTHYRTSYINITYA